MFPLASLLFLFCLSFEFIPSIFANTFSLMFSEAKICRLSSICPRKMYNKVDFDIVFSIMGEMLMSEKVKDWNPNIYFVKTMDSDSLIEWTYARRPQQSSQINRWTETKQSPR